MDYLVVNKTLYIIKIITIIIIFYSINYLIFIYIYIILIEKFSTFFFEVIYSYRNSTNSPYPDIQSTEAREAFEMIMKMKNELSSSKYFII